MRALSCCTGLSESEREQLRRELPVASFLSSSTWLDWREGSSMSHAHSHGHSHGPHDHSHSHSHGPPPPPYEPDSSSLESAQKEAEHQATVRTLSCTPQQQAHPSSGAKQVTATFDQYRQAALSANQRRRSDYYALPAAHRALLPDYSALLNQVPFLPLCLPGKRRLMENECRSTRNLRSMRHWSSS